MSFLLEWLIEGTVLALIAAIVVRFIPPRYAAQRHAIWWMALACVALLPVLSATSRRALDAPPASASVLDAAPVAIAWPDGSEPAGLASVAAYPPFVVPAAPLWVAAAAFMVWLVLALASLARLIVGVGAVRRMAREARPIDPALEDSLRRRFHECRRARAVSIVVSDRLAGACAVGFRRPRIVVSSRLLRQHDRQMLEAVTLHEYAHLVRFDDWTRLLQRILLIIVGVHPAARWISRQIDAECEAACDRFVVDRRIEPAAYVRALASAAELSLAGPRFPTGAVPAMFVPGVSLHQRMARLFSQSRVSSRVARRATTTGAGVLAIFVATAVFGPPFVVTAAIELPVIDRPAGPPPSPSVRIVAAATIGPSLPRLDAAPAPAAGASSIQVASVSAPPPQVQAYDQPVAITVREPAGGADEAAGSGASAPLVSTPLAHAQHVRLVPSTAESGSPDAGWTALGGSAARAGSATGDVAARAGSATGEAAARAGSAIARAFRKSGLAIASRF